MVAARRIHSLSAMHCGRGPAEVRPRVRESLRQGATAIKLMAGGGIASKYDPIDTTQFSLEEMRAAVESAADWGTYVAVHAYTDAAVNRALDAGVKVIEHGHLLSEATLKRLKTEGAYLSSQSFGAARRYVGGMETERGRKGAMVRTHRSSDDHSEEARHPGRLRHRRFRFVARLRGRSRRVRLSPALVRFPGDPEAATSVNAKLLALTGPRNPYRKARSA